MGTRGRKGPGPHLSLHSLLSSGQSSSLGQGLDITSGSQTPAGHVTGSRWGPWPTPWCGSLLPAHLLTEDLLALRVIHACGPAAIGQALPVATVWKKKKAVTAWHLSVCPSIHRGQHWASGREP